MTHKSFMAGVGGTLVLTGALALSAGSFAAAESVKLTGCLVKGEGDGYILVNSPIEPAVASASKSVEPGALGTSGSFANVFYWLDSDNDLKPHIGHQIAVEGDTKGDVKEGEMKVD